MIAVRRLSGRFLSRFTCQSQILVRDTSSVKDSSSLEKSNLGKQPSNYNKQEKNKSKTVNVNSRSESEKPNSRILVDYLVGADNEGDGFDPKMAPRGFYADAPNKTAHITTKQWNSMDNEASLQVQQCLNKLSIIKDNVMVDEIAEAFRLISQLGKVYRAQLARDKGFHMLCEYAMEFCTQFTNEQLVDVIVALTGVRISPNHPMLAALEQECIKRAHHWDTRTQLQVSDAWRVIGRSVSMYNNLVLQYIEKNWTALNKHELVQLLYIIGEHRSSNPSLMSKLETLLMKYVYEFTVKEIAIVCLGFYKSKFAIRSSTVLQSFGDHVSKNIHHIDSFSLVSILKAFRYCHFRHRALFDGVAHAVTPKISTMSAVAAMHVGLTYASLHLFNQPLLDAIAVNAVDKVDQCRSKDIAKYLWTFCSLNYQPCNADDFFSVMIDQIFLKRREFMSHPEHFLSCLVSLAYINRYQYDLINFALGPTFRQNIAEQSSFELSRNLFVLDSSVGIECPDYTGNRLPQGFINNLPPRVFGNLNHELKFRQEMAELTALVQEMCGGTQFFRCNFILPHITTLDIEMHLDNNGMWLPIKRTIVTADVQTKKKSLYPMPGVALQLDTDLLNKLTGNKYTETGTTQVEKDKHYQKIIIVITSRNHHRYESEELLGLQVMKKRQLRRQGYKLVEITHFEWFEAQKQNKEDCILWLKKKLQNPA